MTLLHFYLKYSNSLYCANSEKKNSKQHNSYQNLHIYNRHYCYYYKGKYLSMKIKVKLAYSQTQK